ncbi:UbiA family prenyltransferase, partial [Paenibacillus sp. MCAF20]
MLKDLIALTKPRLLRLNIFAALGGFIVASKWDFDMEMFLLLIYMLAGSTLTIASATVINNYWDRELDLKMERTKDRALPTGRMKPGTVLAYGIILGTVGLA